MCAGKAALALRGSSLLTLERQNAQVKVTSGLFCCFIRKLFSFLSLSFVKVMFSFGSYVNILPNWFAKLLQVCQYIEEVKPYIQRSMDGL